MSAAVRLIDFDLGTTDGFSGTSSLGPYTDTVDGLTLTMTTNDDWNASRKGLSSMALWGTEVSGPIDGYTIQIAFSHDVKFMEFQVGGNYGLTGDEAVRLSATGITSFEHTQTINGSYDFQNQFTLTAGSVLTLTGVNPDASVSGLFWKRIQVEADTIPEPEVYALLLGVSTLGLTCYRRRQKRRTS